MNGWVIIINTKLLGQRIAHYRSEKKLSQKAFAKLIGLSQTSLSNLENGKVESVSVHKLEKIATVLGVTFDQLLIDNLDWFKNNTNSSMPKSLNYIKLQELMCHLSKSQELIVSRFFQYKLKKIENQEK